MKKTLAIGAALLGCVSVSQSIQAAPLFGLGVDNNITFSAVANRVNSSGVALANTAAYSVGDVFYGIVNAEAISSGTTSWNMQNTGVSGSYDTLTGYFVTEIKSITSLGSFGNTLTFGAASFDPRNKLSGAELAAQMMVKFYVDTATAYTTTATNATNVANAIAADVANATDGTPWASFGFAGNGYWDVFAGSGLPSGTIGGGVNFVTNDTGLMWNKVIDQSYDNGSRPVDMTFFSTFSKVNGGWGYSITDPAVMHPVPAPAAAWLLGSGLLGLAGFARRR